MQLPPISPMTPGSPVQTRQVSRPAADTQRMSSLSQTNQNASPTHSAGPGEQSRLRTVWSTSGSGFPRVFLEENPSNVAVTCVYIRAGPATLNRKVGDQCSSKLFSPWLKTVAISVSSPACLNDRVSIVRGPHRITQCEVQTHGMQN